MDVKELGIFKCMYSDNFKECSLIPSQFDFSDRQLFLNKIQPVSYREIGSSNYSYDQIGTYNFIFRVNTGDGLPSFRANEEYFFILQVECSEWYKPEEHLAKDLLEALEPYPILSIDEVLKAFRQRRYYRDYYSIKT
jgi:hypothetical protein